MSPHKNLFKIQFLSRMHQQPISLCGVIVSKQVERPMHSQSNKFGAR